MIVAPADRLPHRAARMLRIRRWQPVPVTFGNRKTPLDAEFHGWKKFGKILGGNFMVTSYRAR
jgi:hypothetical protein